MVPAKTYNVLNFGATGDGQTLDTAAIQRAINFAAADNHIARPRVLIPGGRKYLISTLHLASHIDFHLADDAELLVSLNPADYDHGQSDIAITARNAQNIAISGTGTINGRSPEIMKDYDAKDEWFFPIPQWRPRLVVLTACTDLTIQNITLRQAALWTVHMLGCRRVLIDNIKIRNQLDVPNCDGIDPDHCQDVEIKNCDIVCGDDAIVIKTTRTDANYGPCARIHVHDCTLETQDAGLKIGTETTRDIRDILFERCLIKSSCRGMGIQLRDEGNVSNITFRDIQFTSRYHSDPWWGRGEAISLTAIPRNPGSAIGTLCNIHFENITGRAENSARIEGSAQSRIKNVTMKNVALTLDRWTQYPGPRFDNRPTKSQPDLETHATPGFCVRHADNITLENCAVTWGQNVPDYFSYALEAEDVTHLAYPNFRGIAAHADRAGAIEIRPGRDDSR